MVGGSNRGDASRPVARWALAAAVAALAVVAFVAATGPSIVASKTPAQHRADLADRPEPLPHVPPHMFAALMAGEASGEDLAEDQIADPGCWRGLTAVDRGGSLADLRDVLRAALANHDPLLLAYAQERMSEAIGDDPQHARTVIAWAGDAVRPESLLLMEALRDSAAVQRPEIATRLLDVAANDRPADRRADALTALESQRSLDGTGLAALRTIALDDPEASTAWAATRTLGRVMTVDTANGGDPSPYWRGLLDIGRGGPDEAVRSLALEMPSYIELLLDPGSVAEVADVLHRDPDPAVREMAALRLSVTADRDQALALLADAFPGEPDFCVRWAIFRFTARAGGRAALPHLAEYVRQDVRFAEEHRDFTRIYASGVVDFARVWFEKPERIHCGLHEEDDR